MITGIRQASSLALVLCAGSVFISCDKKDTPPETPGFRLFTNRMEITDAIVKANFLKRSAASFLAVSPVNTADKITFLTPDTVLFGASTRRYSVIKKDNQYLFYSPVGLRLIDKYNAASYMLKYTVPEVTTSDWPGYSFMTQEVRVGYGNTEQIQLSYIQYCLIRPGGQLINGLVFNDFDENVREKVPVTDTLAVQIGSKTLLVQR